MFAVNEISSEIVLSVSGPHDRRQSNKTGDQVCLLSLYSFSTKLLMKTCSCPTETFKLHISSVDPSAFVFVHHRAILISHHPSHFFSLARQSLASLQNHQKLAPSLLKISSLSARCFIMLLSAHVPSSSKRHSPHDRHQVSSSVLLRVVSAVGDEVGDHLH